MRGEQWRQIFDRRTPEERRTLSHVKRFTKLATSDNIVLVYRYSIVGLSVAAFYVIFYCLLRYLDVISIALCNFIAYAMAVSWQYMMQAGFTFGRKIGDRGQISRFVVSTLACYLLSHVVVVQASEAGVLPEWTSLVVVVLLLPIVNFVVLSIWVFRWRRNAN
ncbi:GtrA family protein [Mesorhizobium sp. M0293]|uniref:GtrA family protein n=1 Tax=Mesorhizobium sp. M0293 TaxID=2956930 RepID=UPI00333B5AC7